jgi:hypothetical protein
MRRLISRSWHCCAFGERVEDEAADLFDMAGALSATLAAPCSARVARVQRPSAGSGVRRTQPRFSSLATTLDSRVSTPS